MALQDSDCSICLQNFVHPVQLPCGHIFCFLCIKGCAFHRRRCPMCRSRFSVRFFEDPKLVVDSFHRSFENDSNAWGMDVKTQTSVHRTSHVFMGHTKRKDNSGRKRRIKRDVVSCEKKGVAGIKLDAIQTGSGCSTVSIACSTNTTTVNNTVPRYYDYAVTLERPRIRTACFIRSTAR
ncbi:hypothetical protein AHF37_07133 [Paragonimus kellicotti]|nr:hypothetical protein AHF37_07133 [Paragonimus kellicotti]